MVRRHFSHASTILLIASLLAFAACEKDAVDPIDPASLPPALSPSEAATLDYFLQVGLGFEFGSATEAIRKWDRDMTIEVRGVGATAARLAFVDSAAAEITSLTNGQFAVRRVDRGGHVLMRLEPLDSLLVHAPSLSARMEETGSVAYFTVWTRGFTIGGGSIAIRSELEDHEVNSLILEEVTQVIGLFRDSPQVPGSIFYETPSDGGWAQWYHPIDRDVIRLLYDPAILSGMTYDRARAAAREVLLQG